MPAEFDEAVCIRHWEWSETSQTVRLFARRHGMLGALAKGSRRPKADFSGGVELLQRAAAGLILRPRSDLALLTQWDLQEDFPALRRDLRAFYAGMLLADLVQHAVTDRDPHPVLYDALVRALRSIGAGLDPAPALLRFTWTLLEDTGYRPEFHADVRTRQPVPASAVFGFRPDLGGLVAPEGEGPGDPSAWRVRADTVRLLRRLGDDEMPAGFPDPGARGTAERALRLLLAYFTEIIGRELPTQQAAFRALFPRGGGHPGGRGEEPMGKVR